MTPYRTVTLVELLKHNADAFCRLTSLIGQAIAMIGAGHTVNAETMGDTLGELHWRAEELGLKSATRQLTRMQEELEANLAWPTFRSSLIELLNRVNDELEERLFVVISPEMKGAYEQKDPPFGSEVADAFPLATEDVSEAGKCLALGRCTATVFHLMRAMESAVKRLSTSLGVQNVDKEWGKLLSDITAAIEAMPKGSRRNQWSEARTHLYHVKQAWRNDTMHPKQTYTFEEARAIYEAVKVFLSDLAALV